MKELLLCDRKFHFQPLVLFSEKIRLKNAIGKLLLVLLFFFGANFNLLAQHGTTASTITELRNRINGVTDANPATITITANFNITTDAVVIPANRNITITSSTGNIFTLSIPSGNFRHFVISGSNSSLTLANITLDGGNRGGGVRSTFSNVALTLNNGATIRNCLTTITLDINGGGVNFTHANSTINVNNGAVISGNVASGNGGGICSAGTINLNNGSLISNNESGIEYQGGGIYSSCGTININSGAVISGNKSPQGGGISSQGNYIVGSSGTINMYGGTISNNSSTIGGGIMYSPIDANHTLTIPAGVIISDNIGGGVHSIGSVHLTGGIIRGNTGSFGNGISMTVGSPTSIPLLTISSGEISNNTATLGGGVYAARVLMQGGSVSNNTAGHRGGGFYFHGEVSNPDNEFIMTDGIISGNHANQDEGGGIYTTNHTKVKILGGGANNPVFQNNTVKIWKTPWLTTNIKCDSINTIYQAQCGTFVPSTTNISALPGETLLGASATYDNLYNNYDINMGVVNITYSANFGAAPDTDTYHYFRLNTSNPVNIKVLPNMFTRVGFNFTGWNTKSDGSGTAYSPNSSTTVNVSTTLYAQWVSTCPTPDWERLRTAVANTVVQTITIYKHDATVTENLNTANAILKLCENHNFINSNGTPININANRNVTIRSASANPSDIITLYTFNQRHFSLMMNTARLTIENLVLDGNDNGGGIHSTASPVVTLNSGAVIRNCRITSGSGGAIVLFGTTSTININSGAVLSNNVATGTGGGGAIYTANPLGLTIASGAIFSGNRATAAYLLDASYPGTYLNATHAAILARCTGGQVAPASISLNAPFKYAYNNYDVNYVGGNPYIVNPNSDWERLRTYISNLAVETIVIHPKGTTSVTEGISGNTAHLIISDNLPDNTHYINSNGLPIDINRGTANLTIKAGTTITSASITNDITLFTRNAGDGRHFNIEGPTTFMFERIILDGNKVAGGIYHNYGSFQFTGTGSSNVDGIVIQNCYATNGGGVYLGHDSHFHLFEGVIRNCKAAVNGGGVYVEAGAGFTLRYLGQAYPPRVPLGDGEWPPGYVSGVNNPDILRGIHYNEAVNGGGVYVEAGAAFRQMCEENYTIGNPPEYGIRVLRGVQNNTATLGGGVFNAGTYTFTSGVLTHNFAELGGGVYNTNRLILNWDFQTMTQNAIAFNGAFKPGGGQGGGVYNTGIIDVYKGGFEGNHVGESLTDRIDNGQGGNVYNAESATFKMLSDKATMQHGEGADKGAGVYNAGLFEMQDGIFYHNGQFSPTLTEGGGVYNTGTFKMNDGIFWDNYADNGGGVYNAPNAIFEMTNGSFTDNIRLKSTPNTTKKGGAVYTAGTFTMSGGEMTINGGSKLSPAVDLGGGVYVAGGTFTMTDGDIRNNVAREGGGGVYVANGATFNLQRLGLEWEGYDGNGYPHGYVHNELNPTLYRGVNRNSTLGTGGGVYNAGTFNMDCNRVFDYGIVFKDREQQLYGMLVWCGVNVNTAASGGGVYNTGTMTFTKGETSFNEAEQGGGVYNTGTLTLNWTQQKLEAPIGFNYALRQGGGQGGGVYNTGIFNIIKGHVVVNAVGENRQNTTDNHWLGQGGGVYNAANATFKMTTNADVNQNYGANKGNGVYNAGLFEMEGGYLSMNGNFSTTLIEGGGVYNTGTFKMNGGTFWENYADVGGGIYNAANATFEMTDGAIAYNVRAKSNLNTHPKLGGGVYTAGNFTMSGGTMDRNGLLFTNPNNYLSNGIDYGGGVYVAGGNFTMTNGKITGNFALQDGGGIFTTHHANVTIIGGGVNNPIFQNNLAAKGKTPWLTTHSQWGAVNTIYQAQCGTFVPSTANITALPGETLLGASATYDNLYNNYDINLDAVTLTYHANFVVTPDTETYYFISGSTSTVLPNMFTRIGHNFTGWNTQANGSGTAYNPSSSITVDANTTLYAQWGSVSPYWRLNTQNTRMTHHLADGTPTGWDLAVSVTNNEVTIIARESFVTPSLNNLGPNNPIHGTLRLADPIYLNNYSAEIPLVEIQNVPGGPSYVPAMAPFYDLLADITGLTLANTIRHIGAYAFYECARLAGNLLLPTNLKNIEQEAFSHTPSLATNIVIPASVTHIGGYAFNRSGITGLEFGAGISLAAIHSFTFGSTTNLTTAISIPASVVSIGLGAFQNSAITGVTLLNGALTTIGTQAFSSTANLNVDITIPASVTTLGMNAFAGSAIKSVTFAQGSQLASIGPRAFGNCQALTGVTFTSALPAISDAEWIPLTGGVYGTGTHLSQNVVTYIYHTMADADIGNGTWHGEVPGVQCVVMPGVNWYERPIVCMGHPHEFSFNAQGGTPTPLPITKTDGETFGTKLPGAPSRIGYIFEGWFTEPTGGTQVFASTTTYCAPPRTLYAQWTLPPGFYEVELWNCPPNVGGGGNVYERTIAVEYGKPMPLGVPPSVIKPAQYGSFPGVFLGYGTLDPYSNNYGGTWKIYYNGEMESVRNWDIPKDTALYGIWNNTAFDLVMYHANGGTFDDDLSPFYQGDLYYVMHNSTTTYILPPTTVTRNGYLFTGWNFNASGGAGSEVTELTHYNSSTPRVVYAQWAPNPCSPSDWERLRTFISTPSYPTTLTIYKKGTTSVTDDLSQGRMILCENIDFINSNGTPINVDRAITLKSESANDTIYLYTPNIPSILAENNRHFNVGGSTDFTFAFSNVIIDGKKHAGGINVTGSGIKTIAHAIIQHCRAIDGGGMIIDNNVNVITNNCKVNYNAASWKGGGVCNKGVLSMYGGEISNNYNDIFGGGVYTIGEFNMDGGKINDNYAEYNGGGVYVADGEFNYTGGEINDNYADVDGGGVYIAEGDFYMTGGEINNNEADFRGGGIYVGITEMIGGQYVKSSAEFTLVGGIISNNTATEHGGGVYVDWGTFFMEDGEISGNKAKNRNGGGVVVENSVFEIYNGEITNNTAEEFGGGVYVGHIWNFSIGISEFTMYGGNINNNKAQEDGGGVYANETGLDIYGGTISGNTARLNGGGIFVYENWLTLVDAEVSNNTSTIGSGGGIFMSNASLEIGDMSGGSSSIKNNTSREDGGGIYISGSLSNTAVIEMWDGEISGNTTTKGNGGGIFVGLYAEYKIMDGIISNNKATLGNGGGIYVDDDGYFDILTENRVEISNNTAGGSGGGLYAPGLWLEFGKAYDGDIVISGNSASNNGGGLYLGVGPKFGGIDVLGDNRIEISGNSAGKSGGGVYVYEGWLEFLGNGNIVVNNNTAAQDGGGIYIYDGWLKFEGDGNIEINDNNAGRNGGGVYLQHADDGLLLFKGDGNIEINGNTANNHGGGVFIDRGYLEFEGDGAITISGNTATTGDGGGLYLDRASYIENGNTMVMNNNNAGRNGGALFVDRGWFHIVEGELKNNTANNNGGAIYINRSTLNLGLDDGVMEISNNTAGGEGGAIYIGQPLNIEVGENVTFSGNSAPNAYLLSASYPGSYLGVSHANILQHCLNYILPVSISLGAPFQYAYNNYDINYIGGTPIPICPIPDWERLRTAVANPIVQTITIYKDNALVTEDLTIPNAILKLCENHDFINSNGLPINVDRAITLQSESTNDTIYLYTPNILGIAEGNSRHFNVGGTTNFTFAFNNVIIDGKEHAGGINVAGSGTKTLSHAIVQYCKRGNTGNPNSNSGGGIFIDEGVQVVSNHCIIQHNEAEVYGGGVFINGGTLTMGSGKISGNTAASSGGGVFINASASGSGTFNMSGGLISSNTSNTGGGVRVTSHTNFIINGGEISENSATTHGGGVFAEGNITISGTATISDNTAENGGGIFYNCLNRTFTMNGGEISNNTAGNVGGGLVLSSMGGSSSNTYIVEGGVISENKAKNGGGIFYTPNGDVTPGFVMKGVTVSNNEATEDGGGLFVNRGTLSMENIKFIGNKADNGGGIFTNNHTNLTIIGGLNDVIFQANTANTKTPWLTTNNEWGAINTVYQMQCGTFVPSPSNISALPGETLLGSTATYNNLYNNYDINLSTYTLTYHANFGTTPDTERHHNFTYIPLNSVTVLANMFTRPNYYFVEWNTLEDGDGVSYLPANTLTLSNNTTLYAQWAEIPKVTVTGTVFPFVNRVGANAFNALFPITVSLKPVPDDLLSPTVYEDLLAETPLYSETAIYYDGTLFVEGTPKSPGALGEFNNFGLPINFIEALGGSIIHGASASTILLDLEKPDVNEGATVGLFVLENVLPGEYILEIKREGYVVRWAKITVDAQEPTLHLGHRELIPGDVKTALRIDSDNAQWILSMINQGLHYGHVNYEPHLDLNADGYIDSYDYYLLQKYIGFWFYHYEETKDWIDGN